MKSCSSTTNFRNKGNNVNIPGTNVSFSNAQLLTSTGSSTLDFFLGGGLAVGTICAIEEDRYNSYASLLMKYFLAEGVSRKHSLFLASGDKDPKNFLKELPASKGIEIHPETKSTASYDPIIITSQYMTTCNDKEMPASKGSKFCSGAKSTDSYDPVSMTMHYKTKCCKKWTNADQDSDFNDKQNKLPKQLKFNEILNRKVDTNKINLGIMKLWIAKRITDMLGGTEDDFLIEFVFRQLDAEKHPDGKNLQINLSNFMDEKNAGEFMAELWTLLINAEESDDGIPAALLEFKKDELKKKMELPALYDPLMIAWRYKGKRYEDSIRAESHNIGFDLSKTMPDEALEKCSISTWNPDDCNCDEQSMTFLKMPYYELYEKIKREIESQELKTSSKKAETILRIGINSIGSPLWKSNNDEMDDLNLVRFLYVLKALLRTSFAVGVITIPSYLFSNEVLMSRIRQTCDTVIELESFVGSDKMSNPLFKDFDGLLHVKKLPVLNTFMYPNLTEDLAFKLKKKGLLIERLHLPPELGDPTPEQQAQFGCSGLGKKLDF